MHSALNGTRFSSLVLREMDCAAVRQLAQAFTPSERLRAFAKNPTQESERSSQRVAIGRRRANH